MLSLLDARVYTLLLGSDRTNLLENASSNCLDKLKLEQVFILKVIHLRNYVGDSYLDVPVSSLIYLLVDLVASVVKVCRIRILVSDINIKIVRLVS